MSLSDPLKLYPWSRYWCLRGQVSTVDAQGFLLPPNASDWRRVNQELRTLEQLREGRCLILLGEPGMGKSSTLKASQQQATVEETHFLDLKALHSDDLREELADERLQTWKQGTTSLTLWLDSLDETLDRKLTTKLVRFLKDSPRERLKLRIACRTAQWPDWFELELKTLWKDPEAPEVWELMPLCAQDVTLALQTEHLDVERFERQLQERAAGPLASRPVTLRLLMTLFKRDGAFPATRLEVYQQGLAALCEEVDDSRGVAGEAGTLSVRQRLAIARRMAAVSLLCGQDTFWLGGATEPKPDGALGLAELDGGDENVDEDKINVSEARLREVLRCALFNDRGARLLGWAHRSFAEVLAAEHLVATPLPAGLLLRKLVHPDDDEEEIAPQFQGIAAWLVDVSAASRPSESSRTADDFFELLLKRQPEVLLGCDLQRHSEEKRERLVDALLKGYAHNRIQRQFGQGWLQEQRLAHPTLATQLRAALLAKSRGFSARYEACKIAKVCKLKELEDVFLHLALDSEEHGGIRSSALYALAEFGSIEAKGKLRPLLSLSPELDPNDELHGGALYCLWPDVLSPEELFTHLHARRKWGFIGSYHGFLNHTMRLPLPTHVSPVAFHLSALKWARDLPPIQSSNLVGEELESLAEFLVSNVWHHLTELLLLEAFVSLQQEWMKRRHKVIGIPSITALHSPDDRTTRRQVIAGLLKFSDATKDRAASISLHTDQLMTLDDLDWLVEQFLATDVEAEQRAIRDVINRLLPKDYLEYVDWLQDIIPRHPLLKKWFGYRISIELNSDEAKEFRQWHEEELQWQQKSAARELPRRPESELVEELRQALQQCSSAPRQFVAVVWRLAQNKYGSDAVRYPTSTDLTTLPGWQRLDDPMRVTLLGAAVGFLKQVVPPEFESVNSFTSVHTCGVQALHLLKQHAPMQFSQLEQRVWELWGAVLIRVLFDRNKPYLFSPYSNDPYDGAELPLLVDAYTRVPERMREGFARYICAQSDTNRNLIWRMKLRCIWDPPIATMLFHLAQDNSLPTSLRIELLDELVYHTHEQAITWAEQQVTELSEPSTAERPFCMGVTEVLLRHQTSRIWSQLWPILKADGALAMDVLLNWSAQAEHLTIQGARSLNIQAQGELLSWLLRHYPDVDPVQHPEGAFFTRTRESSAKTLRDSMLKHLETVASPQALQILLKLQEQVPSNTLAHHVRECRHQMRKQGFPYPAPKDLLKWLNGDALKKMTEGLLDTFLKPAPIPVFFSYAKEDRHLIVPLQKLFMGQNFAAFVDIVDLRGGELWEPRLREEIERSRRFYVFWSRHASDSEWVEKEWKHAQTWMNRQGLSGFIIPVLLDDSNPPKGHPLAAYNFRTWKDLLG